MLNLLRNGTLKSFPRQLQMHTYKTHACPALSILAFIRILLGRRTGLKESREFICLNMYIAVGMSFKF